MVAVVAGNGLGLFNASNNILGGAGVLGLGALGQAGGRALVNAATGNLILQGLDEQLSGRGADLTLLRTYNSRGVVEGDVDVDANAWRWDGERTVKFSATADQRNLSGTVTRTAADGHVTVYQWVSSSVGYTSSEGDGANDTVKYVGGEWVWTDGSSRQEEHYGDSVSNSVGRLNSQTDTSGNKITYTYDGTGRLAEVLDFSSGQRLRLVYVGSLLDRVETFELNVDANGKVIDPPVVGTTPIKQVEYVYDNGRIKTVKTLLNPGTGTPTYYSTSYTYQSATSSLITSVTQSDGLSVSFTYDASNRLQSVTDANGKQTFKYISATQTDIEITDSAGNNKQTWTYTYDANQQLIKVESPAPIAGAARLTTTFTYETDAADGAGHAGNLKTITQAMPGGVNRTVTYKYDSQGNRIREFDALGNTISRTYDGQNQLLTETHYKSPDTNVGDNTLPSDVMTTRYAYDSQSRLRFVVSAEGRVSENRYGGNGLLERTVQYTADRYSATGFLAADLATWVTGRSDKSQIQLTQYSYDFRGNLNKRTDYAKADANGAGVLDAAATVTEYTYDGHGELLHTIAVRGSARDQRADLSSLTYDGIGRETQRINASGTQTTLYNGVGYAGGASTIQVTTAAGLTVLSTFDSVGRLTNLSRSGEGTTRETKYFYDAQGRLAMTLGPQNGRHFSFYDAAGRLQFQADSTGTVTGYTYNEAGQLLTQTTYVNRLGSTDAWLDNATTPTKVTKTALVVAAAAGTGVDLVNDNTKDRTTSYHYDNAGRLDTQTDAASVVTTTHYDGASRITDQQTGDRVTRFFYDRDGRQVGVVDPLGYLTENKYDAAGRLVETVRYNKRSPGGSNVSAPVWTGITNQTATGGKPFLYHLPAAYDADGDTVGYSVVGTKPSWLSFDATSLTLSGIPPQGLASYDITLQASDQRGETPKTTTVTVHITVANSAPGWVTLPDAMVVAKTAGYILQLPAAVDNEGGTLTYSIVGGAATLPPGLTFDPATLKITGTPTTAGTYNITMRVADSGTPPLFTDRSFVLQVTNKGPSWNVTPAPPQAVRTRAFNYTVPAAADPESQALTYRIVSGPAWLSVVPGTSTLSGTPPLDPASLGPQAVVMEVQDTFGETARQLSFLVNVVNLSPTWAASLPEISVLAGGAIDYTPPVAVDPEGELDANGKTVTYSYAGTLPAGLSFDASTGRISGTTRAVDVNDFPLKLHATDARGDSTVLDLKIHLLNTPPTYVGGIATDYEDLRFNPKTILIPHSIFRDINSSVTLSVDGATPGTIPFVAGTPPWVPGLYFDPMYFGPAPSHGAGDVPVDPGVRPVGLLTWYDPTATAGAVKWIKVNATDASGATVSQWFSITVKVPPPPPPPPPPSPPPSPPGWPPTLPQAHRPGDGLSVITEPTAPIAPAPAPVLGLAPAPAAIPPAPAPLLALPPLDDVLASWRPAADAKDLHSYEYYDGQGRLAGSVDARGFLTEIVYDAQLNTQKSVQYLKPVTVAGTDTLGTLKTQAMSADGASESVTTEFDSFGRVSTLKNNLDNTVSRNEYDGAGRLVRQISGDNATDHTDQQTRRTRYNAFGEVTGTLGGEGDAALLAAHPAPVQADIDAAIASYGMQYVYDSAGRRIKSIQAVDVTDTQAADVSKNGTLYFYDSEGRLTHTVDALGNVSETLYNSFGQVASTRRYFNTITLSGLTGGSNTALSSLLATNAQDQTTSYTYDQRGLLATSTDGLGFVTTNSYTAFGQLATQVRTILKAAGATAAQTTTTQFSYDLDGQLLVQTGDAGGINFNQQTVYDAFGRVIKSIDAAGRQTQTDYTKDSGRTIEVTDPLNRVVRTQYDAFSRVLKVIDPLGKTTSYAYNDTARSVTITTPEGIQVTTSKTRNGQTLNVVDGRGNSTTYAYNKDGQLTTVTDALTRVVSTTTYDLAGRIAKTTDARGMDTTLTYDALNRVVLRKVDPAGLNLQTKYAFNSLGQQVTVTELSGSNVVRLTSYAYNLDGQLVRVLVDPNGLRLTTNYTYDGLGETIKVARGTLAAPNQEVTAYVFDKLGRRVKEIVAPSAVFGAGSARTRDLTTEYRYDSAGRVSRRIDANGQSTWFVYDDAGQLRQTINAMGAVSENAYDLNGRVVQTRRYVTPIYATTLAGFGDVVSAVTPTLSLGDQRTYLVYDNDGRQRFTVQADSVDPITAVKHWTVSENIFDANGNVIETRRYDQFVNETDANPAKTINPTAPGFTVAQIATVLTALGYQDKELGSSTTDETTLAKIQRTRFAYDKNNRLRFTVDALGSVSERVYDNAGNVITSVRYAEMPTLTADQAHDEAEIDGKVDRANANNQVTQFAYDKAGRLRYSVRLLVAGTGTAPPQQLITRQTYDALNNVVQTTVYATVLGSVANYTVATLDAALAAPAFVNNVQNRTTAFAYDAAGRQVYAVQVVKVDSATHLATQHLIIKQTYDAMGHVVQNTAYAAVFGSLANYSKATLDSTVDATAIANDSQNRTTRFAYDVAGRMRFVVAADGSLSERVYDALGQVTQRRQFDLIVSASTQLASITDAYLIGRRADRKVGDGVTRGETYSYDLAGRLLTTTDAAGHSEMSTYDGLGNRITFIDKNGVELLNQHQNDTPPFDQTLVTWNFSYDRQGRLINKTAPAVNMFLTGDPQPNDDPTPVSHRLQTVMAYDALGNLTSSTEASGTSDARVTGYAYDLLGRQIMLTQPGWYEPGTGKVESAQGAPAAGRFQRTLEATYDTLGNQVRTRLLTAVDNLGVKSYQYDYKTYDNFGRVVHDVDALSNVTEFAYNSFGEQSTVKRYSVTISGTPANAVNWTASEIAGKVSGDGSARTVTMVYDNVGRKTDVTQPSADRYFYSSNATGTAATVNAPSVTGVSASAATHYDYNAFGEVAHEALKVDSVGTGGHWRDTWHYFDTMGRETRTIDAGGYHTARSFDALGNLQQTVEYANAGILGVTDNFTAPATPTQSSKDRITAFTYDALNRRLTIQRFGLSYAAAAGNMVNNARSVATTVQTTTYDSLGQVRTQADALGNTTTNTYDALGRLLTVTEPARNAAAGSAIDPFHNQVSVSPVTTFTYNGFGQVVKQERSTNGVAGATVSTKTTYDQAGNAIRVTDANGNVKERQYDYAGRLTRETQAINVVMGNWYVFNGTPLTWKTVNYTLDRRYAYDAVGRQTSVTDVFKDAANVAQQSGQGSVYNAFGEVTDELRVWGLASAAPATLKKATVTHYDYDNAGHVKTKRAGDGVTEYYYNLAGQRTRQEQLNNAATDEGSVTRITETGYDTLGRATVQRLPGFSAGFPVFDSNNLADLPITPLAEQTFDRWGNVISRSQGGYVLNSTQVADTSQRVTITYDYNADSQVTAEHLPTVTAYKSNGSSYQANVTHSLRYDLLGRAVRELDTVPDQVESLRSRSKTYNAAGQVVSETDATQITTQYAYDANGNRIGTMNAAGTVFVDSFDNNGNVLTHSVLRLASDVTRPYNSFTNNGTPLAFRLKTYQYDAANRRYASESKVFDAAFGSSYGNWSFTQYDERNFAVANFQIRLTAMEGGGLGTVDTSGGRLLNTCVYDVFGNKTSEVDAAGNTQSWTYNWDYNTQPGATDYTVGRMVTAGMGGQTTTYTYNDFGQVRQETYAGVDMSAGALNNRSYTYFENGLLKRVTDDQNYSVAGSDFWHSSDSTTYDYTVKGERAVESFHSEGTYGVNTATGQPRALNTIDRMTSTSYDALGRAIFVSSSPPTTTRSDLTSLEYRYDELGNRREILATYKPVIVTPGNPPIAGSYQSSDKWYDYDKEGRMTVVDGLVQNGQYLIGNDTTTVAYDGLGRRYKTQKWDSAGHFDNHAPASEEQIIADYNNYRRERYTYNDLGYLTQVEQAILEEGGGIVIPPHEPGGPIPRGTPYSFSVNAEDWVVTATRMNDLLGEVTTSTIYTNPATAGSNQDPESFQLSAQASKTIISNYDFRGLLIWQATHDLVTPVNSTRVDNDYFGSGVLHAYTFKQGQMFGTSDQIFTPTFTNTYTYTYSMQFGGFKEKSISISSTQPAQNGNTRDHYDARGNLVRQTIDKLSTNQRQELLFGYDADGHIITKDVIQTNTGNTAIFSGGGNQDYIYALGQQLGVIGAGELAPTTQFSSNFTPISAAYPGSSPGSYTVRAGDTLAGIAQLLFGDGSLWYLIGDANNLNFGPNQALASEAGKTYHIPNVVANFHNNATTFTPYNAAGIIGTGVPMPGLPPPPSTQCITAQQIVIAAVIVAVAIVATVVTEGAAASVLGEGVPAAMAAAGIGAAAGSTAAQLTTIALTDKQIGDFSGTQVLEAGLTGALSAGVGAVAAADYTNAAGRLTMAGRAVNAAGNFFTQAAIHSIISNEFNNQSFLNMGAQMASAALFGGLDGTNHFKVGAGLGQFGMGAVGPGGWVYDDDSRNWSKLASEAVNAGVQIGVGGVISAARSRNKTPAAAVFMPDETGDSDFAYGNGAAVSAVESDHDRIVDLDPDLGSGYVGHATQDDPMPPEYVVVPKSMRNSEELGRLAYPDESAENQVLGSALIALVNGVDPRKIGAGQELLAPALDDYDLGALRTLRNAQNRQELKDHNAALDREGEALQARARAAAAERRQQAAQDAADGIALPDLPENYWDMLTQLPPDQINSIVQSPYFGTVVPVLLSQKIEGETFVQTKYYLGGSDAGLDAAYGISTGGPIALIGPNGESIPIPVLRTLPESRSLAQMSLENGLDPSIATFDQYTRIQNLKDYGPAGLHAGYGSDERSQMLWDKFSAERRALSGGIAAGYRRIDTAATVVNAAAQVALAAPGIIEGGPVAFGYGYYASMGADYAAAKAGLGEDARLFIGLGAGMAASWGLGRVSTAEVEAGAGRAPTSSRDIQSSSRSSGMQLGRQFGNAVRKDNVVGFFDVTNAREVALEVEAAVLRGAKEVNIGSGTHGVDELSLAQFYDEFELSGAGNSGQFLREDLRTVSRLQAKYPDVKFKLYDALDPGEYAAFQRQMDRATPGSDVAAVAAWCHSVRSFW